MREEQPPIRLKKLIQLAETKEAVLVNLKGKEVWLPKSQINITGTFVNAVGLNQLRALDIEIPAWLYEKL